MKKIVLFFLALIPLSYAATPLEASIADTLASYDIIVNNARNPAQYRLGDTITRAEAVWVALRVGDIALPEKYFCRNYFRDVAYNPVNNWICRAIEIASDNSIISRENANARPSTPISRIEALAITMRAGKVPYARNVSRANYPADMPQWQIDILEGALQYRIISSTRNFGPDMLATRIDVFGMIYNMRFAGTKMEYITDVSTAPPLASAPEWGNIIVTIPGNPNAEPETTTPTIPKNALAGFAVSLSKDIKTDAPFDITVKALDASGATLTNYTGTVYFDLIVGAYSDISAIAIDDGYTFTLADKWVLTVKNVIIKKAGSYELDVYEIASGADIVKPFFITVVGPPVTLVTTPDTSQKITAISVTAPKDAVINAPFDMTVSIMNSAGQVITNYTGTIYFGTNNLEVDVVFPLKSYTFTTADKWKKVFSGFKLKQLGNYELSVYEVDTIPNGTKQTVKITAKAPTN
jgi:hypothetical protein